MGAVMSELVGVSVTYVEPSGSSRDGLRTLGHYPMAVPPRKGETVVLEPAHRADMTRYVVQEVIHHMGRRGVPRTLVAVTVLLVPVLSGSDVDRVMSNLCGPGHVANVEAARAAEVG